MGEGQPLLRPARAADRPRQEVVVKRPERRRPFEGTSGWWTILVLSLAVHGTLIVSIPPAPPPKPRTIIHFELKAPDPTPSPSPSPEASPSPSPSPSPSA